MLTFNPVVDCAEGTFRQFAMQGRNSLGLKPNKVTKIFVTHMHGEYFKTDLHCAIVSFNVQPITSWASSPFFETSCTLPLSHPVQALNKYGRILLFLAST